MLSSYCVFFSPMSAVDRPDWSHQLCVAHGCGLWDLGVFSQPYIQFFALASVRDSFCTGAGGDHEQAIYWEHRSLGVHGMLHASLFFFSGFLISVFFHYRGQDWSDRISMLVDTHWTLCLFGVIVYSSVVLLRCCVVLALAADVCGTL